MKVIELVTPGSPPCIVDDEDYDFVSQWRWFLKKSAVHTIGYVTKSRFKDTSLLHRVLAERWGWEIEGMDIDHVNGNSLDNRRENLRVATRSENMCNRVKTANNTSGFKGVTWNKQCGKWRARVKLKGKSHHLGYFENVTEAADAYAAAARRLHGSFARLS